MELPKRGSTGRSAGRIGRKSVTAAILLAVAVVLGLSAWISVDGSRWALAQSSGTVPGNSLGNSSDSDLWRAIRKGDAGNVSIANKQAGVMIQSEGDNWRAIRNGPLSTYGGLAIIAIVGLLAIFLLARGRIRISRGLSGVKVQRFNGIERFAHWLLAISFIILALSGLNLLYGRYLLLPLIGPDAFAAITIAGKYAHNYVAFPFMGGVVLVFVLWIIHNFPNRYDLIWIAKAGGMFSKDSHPPAKKFNAGQKLIFWLVVLGGLSLSLSGIALMFPFKFSFFADTFVLLNKIGFELPAELTPMQEMQYSQLWHAIVAIALIVVVIAHIYIGTIGMEGAFDAMGTGDVDANWAHDHHSVWAENVVEKPAATGDD